ncbi:MAG: hypothetical protein HYV29_08640 [Ignavibacteriales bacterium]|nr:hypothetical protein [Ignavibacteriales bacterium]
MANILCDSQSAVHFSSSAAWEESLQKYVPFFDTAQSPHTGLQQTVHSAMALINGWLSHISMIQLPLMYSSP